VAQRASRLGACLAADLGRGSALEERKCVMRILGYVTAVTPVLASAGLTAVVVRGLPDVRRYLKMRSL
jgi:hypothetical protein